ncbi:MAG: radical SAM protein [Nitrospinae bacterium]|nr:radical SAM protein [Nitrospinota bacterium]
MTFVPYAVSWNLTGRCNLACDHCYLDANARTCGDDGELTTEQAIDTVGQIAALNPESVLILTGGEPLLRHDLDRIVGAAAAAGLMVVLGTNGVLLDRSAARRLKEAGLAGVGVSIDSLDPLIHDTFRRKRGALSASMQGLAFAREEGLSVQVQTTVMRSNIRDIPLIAQWAHHIGAKVFNLFFLVCVGRGEQMTDISPTQYEETLRWAASEKDRFPGMMVRPKCAPHFKRILHQNNPDDPLLSTYVAACRAGTHYLRITPHGAVTPCPYMETQAGSLTRTSLSAIWADAPELTRFRRPDYEGKCGRCRYRLLCGGCRARALATVGDPMGEDQWCVYEPVGVEAPITTVDTDAKFGVKGESSLAWDADAEAILGKIPFFARPMVRMGVERRAMAEKVERITLEYFRRVSPSPRMFGDAAPPSPVTVETATDAAEIPWTPDAKERVSHAPEFVRPGIPKLMQKRACERGKTVIDSAFLSEIRDESMMLASRRIKKLGIDELSMDAWDAARKKLFAKSPEKIQVIDTITELLNGREQKNGPIVERFSGYMADSLGKKLGWSKEARLRMERAPAFVREKAARAVEGFARENGYRIVNEEALDKALAQMPFGAMTGASPSPDRT